MKSKFSWLAAPYVLWMMVVIIVPIFMVMFYAFTTANSVELAELEGGLAGFFSMFTLENFARMGTYTVIFVRSFRLALVATVICLLIGYPLAYVMAKEGPGFQRIAMVIIMLPMWVNFLLRTYAWMAILENNGLLNQFFDAIGLFDLINNIFGTDIERFRMIRTQGAVVLGMVYNYLPFMILPIYTAMTKIDNSVIEAAQDLGCNVWQILFRVLVPLTGPGIATGITQVFVPAVSTFIISRMLGGGSNLLIGDLIEMQFLGNSYNLNVGSAMSLVLMIIVLLCMSFTSSFDEDEMEGVS